MEGLTDGGVMATPGGGDRPSPPGAYQVVVIGSGPGGLQVAYWLRRHGLRLAVLSGDPSPGGMFRRWPFFQRLLSWTKPHALPPRGSRAYERFDWNSLVADEAHARARQAPLMDGTSEFPARAEMEANLAAFARETELAVRYDCRWESTRARDGGGFIVETSDGIYEADAVVVAVGVAEPYTPPGNGMDLTHHYAQVRPPESYAGRRVVILGKQNSGFELANGLLPWACSLALVSPSAAKLSVQTRTLGGVRARYVQPYEDHVLGGGVSLLDAAIDRIERVEGGDGTLAVHLRRTDGGGDLRLEAEDVISATGFTAPLRDLADLGVVISGRSRLAQLTAWWESTTVPGVWFAGTLGQAAKGLEKHGVPANSGAVHGARYNARALAERLAETQFGIPRERPSIDPAGAIDFIVRELAEGPELWHQRAYLTRILTADPEAGLVDDGVQPLTHFLDTAGPDAMGLTIEADGSGAIYPVVYSRRDGQVTEHRLDADPLLRYDTDVVRQAVTTIARETLPGVA